MTANVTSKNIKMYLFLIAISITLFSSMTVSVRAQQINIASGFDVPITLDEIDAVGIDTSIAIGVDGNPVISYRDLANEDLKFVHCMNPSCIAFKSPLTLDSNEDVGRDSSIAIGVDGNPVISYFDDSNGDLKLVHCNNSDCSSFDKPIILDGKGDVGRDSSIAIGVDGNPVISYFDNTNNNLKLIHCISTNCLTYDSPITVDGNDDDDAVGRDTSIAVGIDGNPVISYRASTGGNLKLVHCTSSDCAEQDTPIVLDSNGTVGFDTSIAIGIDGNPIISYFDNVNANLKLVHCTSSDCAEQDTPIVLDSNGTVGRDTSIAIGRDGNPVISYSDDTFGNLKLVHCTSVDCSNYDAPLILDNNDAVGITTSIAIGIDGNPIISYFDGLTSDLKVVHCTTISCSTIIDSTF